MRASKLIGAKVTNAADESVGEINEIVLGKDGKVAAVIVGVGGFLGMGEREVAISYSGLKFAKDSNNRDVITVNATKDQLKAAPAWKWDTATTPARSVSSRQHDRQTRDYLRLAPLHKLPSFTWTPPTRNRSNSVTSQSWLLMGTIFFIAAVASGCRYSPASRARGPFPDALSKVARQSCASTSAHS